MVVEAGTNQHAANGKAELFTGSGGRSLLCLASIKGNSAEDFLVGVMRANNCTEARLKRHRRFVGHASADELHLSKRFITSLVASMRPPPDAHTHASHLILLFRQQPRRRDITCDNPTAKPGNPVKVTASGAASTVEGNCLRATVSCI